MDAQGEFLLTGLDSHGRAERLVLKAAGHLHETVSEHASSGSWVWLLLLVAVPKVAAGLVAYPLSFGAGALEPGLRPETRLVG